MRSVLRPASVADRVRHLAAVNAPLALALALLPVSDVAGVSRSFPAPGATAAESPSAWQAAEPSQAPPVELAGRKSGDESFDPYGKDDPTSKKWGTAAGLLGNRYGGIRTGGGDANNAGRRDGRDADRDDRDSRSRRAQEGGRN